MDAHRRRNLVRIAIAAQALLDRIDNLTTDEFSKSGEHKEREALRARLGQREDCTCERCLPEK